MHSGVSDAVAARGAEACEDFVAASKAYGLIFHFESQAVYDRALRAAGFGSPDSDARRIVEQASGFEGAELALGLSEPATVRGVSAFDAETWGEEAVGQPINCRISVEQSGGPCLAAGWSWLSVRTEGGAHTIRVR